MAALGSIQPDYFSWIVENKVCGMGFPWEKENIKYLLENNVYYLITLTEEIQPKLSKFTDLQHLICKVEEFESPTLSQIQECVKFMETAIKNDKAVGVHCYHGRGRTGTVLACYLVYAQGMTAKNAISYVRDQRPWSVETQEQEQIVAIYEESLTDS